MESVMTANWKSGAAPAWGSLRLLNERHRLKGPRQFFAYWIEGEAEKCAAGYLVRNNVVEARFYRAKSGTRATCCLYIGPFGDVSGKADGHGYDKDSSALAVALDQAGISLSANISGAGISAIEQALVAVGRLVSGKADVVLGATNH